MVKKIAWGIVLTICSVLLIWIGISFIEVQAQNDIGPRNYSNWNAFSIIMDISENRQQTVSFFIECQCLLTE